MPSLVEGSGATRAGAGMCAWLSAGLAAVWSLAVPAASAQAPEARRLPADGGHPAYVHAYVDLNNDRAMDLGLVGPRYRGPGALERCVLVFRNEHDRTPLALLTGPEDESFGTNARLVADHDGDGLGDLAIESRFLDAEGNVRLREHVFGSVSFLPIAHATEPRTSARVLAPAGDVNYDGAVDASDIARWIDSYLRAPTFSTNPADPLVIAAQQARRAELIALVTNPDALSTRPPATLHPRRMDVDGDGLVTLADLEVLIGQLGALRDEALAPVGAIVDDEGDGPVAPLMYLPPRNTGGTGSDAGDGQGAGSGGSGGSGSGGDGGGGGGGDGGPTDPTPCDHDRLDDLHIRGCAGGRWHNDTQWLPMPSGGASAWTCLSASAGAEWTWEIVSGDGRIEGDATARAITLEAFGPGAITVRVTARDAGCSASATFTVRAYRVDVDIDAFNVAPHAAPTGDQAEEDAEDELGRFVGEPGKVIVAGLGDTDGDGIADQLDGFNRDRENPDGTAEDDQCDQRFVPMRIRVEGLSGEEISRARLTLHWTDSDPLRIDTTCESFMLVPEGTVRVWTVDGSAPRSGRAADCGGEWLDSRPLPYEFGAVFGERTDITVFVEGVVPGPWGSLSGGPVTLGVGVEPYTHTETVLGVEVPRFGGEASDSVAARVVGMQLMVRTGEDEPHRPAMELHVSTLLDALDPSLQAPFVRTSVWIADDRDLAGEWLHVADAPIAIAPMAGWEGSFWTTEEFVLADFGGDPRWHGAWIEITGDGAEVWYNPWKWFKSTPRLLKALEYLPEITSALDEVFASIEADESNSWRQQYSADDDGAFGKEVHKRFSATIRGQPGWLADVWIDTRNKQIIQIGGTQPPGYSAADLQQVDAIKFKEDRVPTVGQVINRSNVESAVELKTSSSGRVADNAKTKYNTIFGTQGWRTYRAPRIWQNRIGWIDNPTERQRGRLSRVAAIGAGGTAALALVTPLQAETIRTTIDPMLYQLSQEKCPHDRKVIVLQYANALFDYFGTALDLTSMGGAFRWAMQKRIIAEDW